jgi:hypothetical protein
MQSRRRLVLLLLGNLICVVFIYIHITFIHEDFLSPDDVCNRINAVEFPPTPSPRTPPSHTPSPTPSTSSFIAAILKSHNDRRARHDVQSLTWSDELANSSQNWAKHNCIFMHDPSSQYGENIGVLYSATTKGAAELCDMFYDDEACKYDYANPKFTLSTGHFSQVVWKSTTKVGCAMVSRTECPQGVRDPETNRIHNSLLVCRYHPAGNQIHNFATNVMQPTTAFSCNSSNKLLN